MSDIQAELLRQISNVGAVVATVQGQVGEIHGRVYGLSADVAVIKATLATHPESCPFVAYQKGHPEATEAGRELRRREADKTARARHVVGEVAKHVLAPGAVLALYTLGRAAGLIP